MVRNHHKFLSMRSLCSLRLIARAVVGGNSDLIRISASAGERAQPALGLKIARTLTQGSSRLATLGWRTQSLWDCRFERPQWFPLVEWVSQIRRSEVEGRRPKPEGRRPKEARTALGIGFRISDFKAARLAASLAGQIRRPKVEGPKKPEPRSASGFGLRNSAFFRPSGFGLRISKRRAWLPAASQVACEKLR